MFLRDNLQISPSILARLVFKSIWIENSTIFSEFASYTMVLTIFNHMKNLSGKQRVQKYFPLPLKLTHQPLFDRAYDLRHNHGYKTRFDFHSSGLLLSFKKPGETLWCSLSPAELDTPHLHGCQQPTAPHNQTSLQNNICNKYYSTW